ncbi:hypothetical protein [Anaerosalibacter sp. Marseille-P3206]|uniref:hypothetical protein n=1 Tax=Anaerosalibacter sp. Marseille-P3206 TaxID=1871005 RepID=UPI000986B2B8|nr:hypothetical protein [Anaerosalibacter sp. Marseille-P3206]
MSLLDVLFLFLVFLFPILAKSIQEKQRIEQSRRKRTQKTTTSSKADRRENLAKERKSLYEEKYQEKREPILAESNYENYEEKIENVGIKTDVQVKEISAIEKTGTKLNFNKLTKNDLVKGIILKEILSEPKCMKNM